MNQTLVTLRTHPTLGELQAGMEAVRAGRFRTTPRPATSTPKTRGHSAWRPIEQVIPIIGASGSAGATTLAVALASISPAGVRVVECGPPAYSGLAAASTAELGHTGPWRRGLRDSTHGRFSLERLAEHPTYPNQVPVPNDPDRPITRTYVDCFWPLPQLLDGGWIGDQVRTADAVVVAAVATLPGISHLEVTLTALAEAGVDTVEVVVRGPIRNRWDRAIAASIGVHTRALEAVGRLHEMPVDRHLAIRGLTTAELPKAVVRAAESIAANLPDSTGLERRGMPASPVIDQAC